MLPPPITMQTCTPMRDHVADIGGDRADGVVVEAILAAAHQGFA